VKNREVQLSLTHQLDHLIMAENDTTPAEATIILPPPAIKTIVDKTAAFIAPKQNAAQLEERFRQREQTDSRFSFLNPTNPYYAYYADRLAAFRAGEQPETKGDDKVDPTKDSVPEDDGRPKEPPALEFLVEDPPKISPVDL
jgi:splicing factor 3A subunit 1